MNPLPNVPYSQPVMPMATGLPVMQPGMQMQPGMLV